MAITVAQAQQLVIDTVGDCDDQGNPFPDPPSSGVISRNIEAIWESHAGIPAVLQQEYSKRDAIDLVLARIIHMVDTTVDTVRVYKAQRARALMQLRAEVSKNITKYAAGAALGSGAATIAELAAFEPKYPKTDREFLGEIRS